eukprot:CAMPEP_0115827500 /NCGR_PEP_ID=MMETSP0287-20121206/78_1 /TAXON_ID=412157 /ORGANISM="Chrysochromulina rotalis, Strain UIO044" /LENGTH=615 /DNA_ID=CAMNT_0003280663 /DNA_START=21 /DNA_END=1869 /DNA_ORIENTATION=+
MFVYLTQLSTSIASHAFGIFLTAQGTSSVTVEEILRCFTRAGTKSPASDESIVALYTCTHEADVGAKSRSSGTRRGTRQTVVEHLTAAQLKDFLVRREKVNDGQLQRYVVPRSGKNATFVAVWSPHNLLLEKWVNATNTNHSGSSVYARTVTHEGEPFSAMQQPIRGERFPMDVMRTCRSIVEHTASVSVHRICINRLSLTFKLDEEGKLWLSTCTSLRYARSPGNDPDGSAASGSDTRAIGGSSSVPKHTHATDASGMQSVDSLRGRPQSAASASGRLQHDQQPSPPDTIPPKPSSVSSDTTTKRSRDTSTRLRRPQTAGSLGGAMESEAPLNLEHTIRPALGINPKLHAIWTNPTATIDETASCVSCGRPYVNGTSAKLPYRVLIGSYRRKFGILTGHVPKPIADKHPSLAYHHFEKLVQSRDPGFLSRTVNVCEVCWVKHVARGAPSLHSDGAPRSASTATLQRAQRDQRTNSAAQRRAELRNSPHSIYGTPAQDQRSIRQSSCSAPALGSSASADREIARGRVSPNSWAARDLIYLIGHKNRGSDRQGGEIIVPQISDWAASEIAERGVSTGTGRGGLSEAKVLELFERVNDLSAMNSSKDLKDLVTILKE